MSDAQAAEEEYTAFTSKKGQPITARLIVRRVRDLNPKAGQGSGELFPLWRYHPVSTDSPFTMLQAEAQHRDHAIVEQVFADWANGPLAHLPSAASRPTLRGSPRPRSPTTCCAPPAPRPPPTTPGPAAPPSAPT